MEGEAEVMTHALVSPCTLRCHCGPLPLLQQGDQHQGGAQQGGGRGGGNGARSCIALHTKMSLWSTFLAATG